MKKHFAKKATVIGMVLFSSFSANMVMAADKVVVIPLIGSSKSIYTLGTNNLFVGEDAGNRTMTGTNNTGVGYGVLAVNTTGSYNTASGTYALNGNLIGDYNTANGTLALNDNTAGDRNTATGRRALEHNTTGFFNTAIGYNAGSVNTTGTLNTFLGYSAQPVSSNLSNATAIGYNAVVSASNRVRIGDTFVTQIGGQVGWTALSDRRHKKDIQDLPLGLDFIKALRPVEFRMIDGNDRLDFGFLAQEIEALLGEDYNVLGIDNDSERTLSLRYTDFIAPMVKAMQEQQDIIEQQKVVNEQQEEYIAEMRSELDDMKAEIKAIKANR